jgi:hypothetical protein
VAHDSVSDRAAGDVIVYVMKSGTKYHRAGCSSLRRSAIPMPLQEAAAKHNPCTVCRPSVP